MKSKNKGLKRILKAFTYSFYGFKASFETETAFRQDLIVFFIGIVIIFFLPILLFKKAVLFFSLVLILLMELINTAIEVIVDRISDDYHILSKKAKDIGSLLVLISFINAIIVWLLILLSL